MAPLTTTAINNNNNNKLTCPQQASMLRQLEQRGPSRINAARDIRPSTVTQPSALGALKLGGSSSGIAKVIQVSHSHNSALMQPVAATGSRRLQPVSRSGAASRQQPLASDEPSARVRPTSLALKSPTENCSITGAATNSSQLKLSNPRSLAKNAATASLLRPNNLNKQSTSTTAKPVAPSASKQTPKVRLMQAKQAHSNHDSRSSASLKTPAPVLVSSRLAPSPSPANRANLKPTNLTTKAQVSANKISPTATNAAASSVTATMNIRYETGKVNKDANSTSTKTNDNSSSNEKKRESKQDGGNSDGDEMVIALPRRLPLTATTNGLASTSTRNLTNQGYTQNSSATSSIAGRPRTTAALPQPCRSYDRSNPLRASLIDIEAAQNPPNLSSDVNCFGARLFDKQQSKNNLAGHTLLSTMTLSQQLHHHKQQQVHQCLSATESGMSETLAPALAPNGDDEVCCKATISNSIQSKPMGQQVLSLMMLDVGLLPATNDQTNLHKPASQKRNHVSLHHQSMQDDAEKHETNPVSCSLMDVNWNRVSRHELRHNEDINLHNSVVSMDHEVNPSLTPTQQILKLRLPFDCPRDSKSRSISLPTSPCLRLNSYSCQSQKEAEKLFLFKQNNSYSNLKAPGEVNHPSDPETSTNRITFIHSPLSCDNQKSSSISSSCSSLTQCPPSLTLPNRFQDLKELVKVDTCLPNVVNVDQSTLESEQCKTYLWDQAQVMKQHELLTSDLNLKKIEKYQSDEVYPVEKVEVRHRFKSQTGSTANFQQLNASPQSKMAISNGSPLTATEFQQHQTVVHQHSAERQAASRSHSISENGYHSNAQFQRLKQSVYNGNSNTNNNNNSNQRIVDNYKNYGLQYAGQQAYQIPAPHQQPNQFQRRSPSPLDGHHVSYREAPVAYSAEHLTRNQMHASLECLNASYAEYQHQELKKFQEHRQQLQCQQAQQQQIHQQQQQQLRNQHYASSYVLVAPPVNTVINQNGDQDLAAAAMDTNQSQSLSLSHYKTTPMPILNNAGSNQSMINRTFGPITNSPYRRLNNSAQPGGISPIAFSNLSNPIRAGHSSLSLASSSFILEDKLQNEIRKLQAELKSEIEKNDALNSQLNINSSLMAAFEQSLTTLNTRLRQLTTLNEKKDSEIEELREQIKLIQVNKQQEVRKDVSTINEFKTSEARDKEWSSHCDMEEVREKEVLQSTIKELRRQLLEKDRLLTDTRLEALSAAHQLEQLESKMNGEHSLLNHEDEVEDEGVMVVNHSPSDSEAVTDSVNLSENTCQVNKSNDEKYQIRDQIREREATPINFGEAFNTTTNQHSQPDDQNSNHSSDLYSESREEAQPVSTTNTDNDSGVICKLMDSLIVSN